jgi:RHS repeat-associated protein
LTSESNSAVDLLFGFTGRPSDDTTGLQNNWHRWYDAALGQWLSEDPIGFWGDDTNLRRYVGNEPLSFTDPAGLAGASVLERIRRLVQNVGESITNLGESLKKLKNIDPETLELVKGLALDLGQFALDIGGIFEPTLFCDGTSAVISLFRRDWLGAGLGALGMIPYFGDLAKAGKLGKYAKSVVTAIELASKFPELMKVFRPVFEQLQQLLKYVDELPLDKVPDCARKQVAEIKDQLGKIKKNIDDFLSKNPAEEGIYEFPDQKAGGTPYVGQSENIPRRLGEHEAAGRLAPGTETTTSVPEGKTAREIAEHNRIQELTGGQKAKNSPSVSNQRDPVGSRRRPGFGLPEPRD